MQWEAHAQPEQPLHTAREKSPHSGQDSTAHPQKGVTAKGTSMNPLGNLLLSTCFVLKYALDTKDAQGAGLSPSWYTNIE